MSAAMLQMLVSYAHHALLMMAFRHDGRGLPQSMTPVLLAVLLAGLVGAARWTLVGMDQPFVSIALAIVAANLFMTTPAT